MTNPNLTAIGFVLDRSGSMITIRNDTIGGFNSFMEDQRKAEGECVVTLAQFDHDYDVIYDNQCLTECEDLNAETYQPRGSTALLDAIGKMINGLGSKFENMPEDERPGNVIIAVMTDGEENYSKEYTRDKIFEMIEHQKSKYEWEFIFLGAGQDAISVGQMYGFDQGKSVHYSVDNMGQTMASLSRKVAGYRSAVTRGLSKGEASVEMNYSQEDRDELV